ncbi:podocalyxin [Rhineura floridana]|uniref:podocalyxin n=1 Tax=Rhineura floridana TaxID=261503 RepID=UPI002AC86A20|nr:podocalyxin [Rhineura floridana]
MRKEDLGAALAMRSALPRLLALLLLGATSCRGADSSTAASPAPPTVGPAPTSTQSAAMSAVLASGKAVPSSEVTTAPKATTLPASSAKSSTLTIATAGGGSSPLSVTTQTTKKPAEMSSGAVKTTFAASLDSSSIKPSSPSVADKMTSAKDSSVPPPTTPTSLLGITSKETVLPTHSSGDLTHVVAPPSPALKPNSTSAASTVKSSAGAGTTTASGGGGAGAAAKEKTTSNPAVSPSKKSEHVERTTKTPVPTTKQLGETNGSTATQSPGAVPRPPDSSSVTSATTRPPSAAPGQHVPSPTSKADDTSFLVQTKMVCEEIAPPEDRTIILTWNQSIPCNNLEKSPMKELLLSMLCKSMKPNFNRSRDGCMVRLASIKDDPKYLAILGVSVQTNSVPEELFESLAVKKGELEKLGVNNITHGGRTMDIDTEDRFSMPLIITIVCMAASLLLAAAIYGCCHQRISQRKDQQRLTEELQTMENGYHDNPTLEVMETSSEMQEKKVNLNGELGDSWIVPMDSLTKEDLEEEEDTHL